ncbi:uncharacterized protein LOC134283567 [Saccostrea cucullata]|uniref:uncharacterized protein LOC134283567 n=1 Tax=Saccostrea cuccullata TaxID=36930 RepID=UPI002ED57A92
MQDLLWLVIILCSCLGGYTKPNEFVKRVKKCPSNKQEWERAVKKSRCELMSRSYENIYNYHCLKDEWLDNCIEVCAPSIVIIGHCPEYNTVGDLIQENFLLDCTKFTVPCPKVYNSTDIYKYQECYEITTETLVENILTHDDKEERQIEHLDSTTFLQSSLLTREENSNLQVYDNKWRFNWIFAVIVGFIALFCAVFFYPFFLIKKMSHRSNTIKVLS